MYDILKRNTTKVVIVLTDLTIVRILTETFGYFVSECEDYNSNEDFDEFCCERSEEELTKIKQKLVSKRC